MVAPDMISAASCPARAALAGNPSDGHGGAVVAITIESRRATVTVNTADAFRVQTSPPFDSIDDLGRHFPTAGDDEDQPLVPAALVTLREHLGADPRPVSIDVDTTIPRSVGLAGSSAIVIATMLALAARHKSEPWASRLLDEPSLLASLALAAERDVLGIAAGLQDRVVQSFGGTVAMEFGDRQQRTIHGLAAGTYRSLPPPPGAMAVAYRPDTAGDSGSVHSQVGGPDPAFVKAMTESANQARRAAQAIESADPVELGRAMDATFDLRASAMALDPRHVEMIDVARARGAWANYTGSGGAIVLLAVDRESLAAACTALRSDLGCHIVPML